jgi:outer membrane lipoprotein-sorting protein
MTCLWVVLAIAGCAAAEPADMKGKTLTAQTSADDALDAMDLAGRDLKDFDADVTLNEEDLSGAAAGDVTREGKVWFQLLAEGQARVHIVFEKSIIKNKIRDQRLEYMLDEKGWLTERVYEKDGKGKETQRQVIKPGEKINLLKLGEGPFPMPIGQKKEDVKKIFDVKKVESTKDDPANTVHLEFKPKPDSSYAKRFESIDVYVDSKTHLPLRIATLDKNQKLRTTDMKNFRLNPGLKDDAFKLPDIDGSKWNRVTEEYQE